MIEFHVCDDKCVSVLSCCATEPEFCNKILLRRYVLLHRCDIGVYHCYICLLPLCVASKFCGKKAVFYLRNKPKNFCYSCFCDFVTAPPSIYFVYFKFVTLFFKQTLQSNKNL